MMRIRAKLAVCLLMVSALLGGAGTAASEEAITVVLYNDVDVNGDMNTPWSQDDDPPTAVQYQERNLVRTIKALRRSFAERVETHGHPVHVIAVSSISGLASSCAQRYQDAIRIALDLQPFAVVSLAEGSTGCFVDALTEHGIMTFGAMRDVPRDAFLDNAPYVWSMFPDQETEAAYAASFICRSLRAKPARFTADATLRSKPRRFGIVYPQRGSADWTRGPESAQLAELLIDQTREQCGMRWSNETAPPAHTHLVMRYLDGGTQGGAEAPQIMRKFVANDVTTVICYCVPVQNELTVVKMQSAATALGYLPEWYFDHGSRMDKTPWHKTATTRAPHQAFGVSYWWLMPGMQEQPAYRAYLEQEPGTTPNERFLLDIYNAFHMLYLGIQAGGADPSPSSIEQGLAGYSFRDPGDPSQPWGGFETTKPNPYTFIDTAVAWWWDPTGQEPGAPLADGCIRLAEGGARYPSGSWPPTDAALGDPATGPCTGPPHTGLP